MTAEWTEGACDDGAAILRDGQPVPITELLEHLNKCESIRSAALEEAAKVVDEHAAIVLRVAAMQGEEKPLNQTAHNMCHWTLTSTAIAIRALKDKPHE